MAATGKAALQAGPAAPQKPCTLARPVHRASRLVARKPARVQAVAAPPREYTTAESLSLDDDAPTTTFTAGQSDSVDAAIAQEPRGRQEYRLPAPLDAVSNSLERLASITKLCQHCWALCWVLPQRQRYGTPVLWARV